MCMNGKPPCLKGAPVKILIVEDDARLSAALTRILKDASNDVDAVADGKQGLEWGESGYYDVIILDVMLPKMDGFQVSAELRRKGVGTPILMLTARTTVTDKITGLDSGADDYMTKPFSPAELMAHLRALTRRKGEVEFETLTFADIVLNLQSFDLSCNGKSIHLSFKEFGLMRVLMANPGMTVSKEVLIEKVWGASSSAEDNNVEAYVSFLRKKLAFLKSTVQIETLRRAGYRLVVAEGAEEAGK